MNQLLLGKYRHYKGREYLVIGTALHSETLEPLVVYKALYSCEQFIKGQLWVRPLTLFLEKVLVNEELVPRFLYLGKD